MNNEWPSPETEKTLEQRIVELLQERGSQDPEVQQLLIQLIEEDEKNKDQKGFDSNLDFALKYARLYRDAGLNDEAIQALEDAYDIAYQEQNTERCAEISGEIDTLAGEEND